MARMNKYEARHIRNVEAYKREVQKIFDEATKEALRMGIRFDADTGKPFSFDDYPATKRKFEALMAKMHQRLMAVVRNGVDDEYELAQDSAGAQIRSVFPALSAAQIGEQLRKLANSNAKAAFEQRRKRGLGLSDKVWQYTGQYKQELEMALDIGIGEGKSAQALSREVRKYLRQPNMLFRKVRDKHGVLHLSKRAKSYHPGRGVYRSSAKNALRMVATETNIAYRSADYLNTVASPWIVGIRIVLSNNHTCKDSQGVAQPFTDICDKLAGRYPKDFKFTGWHPNCHCHIEYIHKTDAEVERDTKRMLRGEKPIEAHESKNFVGELPKSFKKWAEENKQSIINKKSLPYVIDDNKGMMSGDYLNMAVKEVMGKAELSCDDVQTTAVKIANKYGAIVTPINLKSEASIIRKIKSERENDSFFAPVDLKDTVRTTIIAPNDKIGEIITELKSLGNFVRYKAQNTELGYTGNIINIETSQGLVAEIQVNTAKMIYAKEIESVAKAVIGERLWNEINRQTGINGGEGHVFYEKWRVIADKSSKKAIEIKKKSIAYYKNFTN
jgi:hypothetical protein